MGAFNEHKITDPVTRRVNPTTTNLAGGQAYELSPKFKLALQVLTSFVENQFYRSKNQVVEDIKKAVSGITDKTFVAKLAIYARHEHGLRSVSHLLAGELVKNSKGQPWLKTFLKRVVYRVDDMLEITAYYLTTYSKKVKSQKANKFIYRPFPNSIKKAFKEICDSGKFDEYQWGKYRKEASEFSLIDLVNLIRPSRTVWEKDDEGILRKVASPASKLARGTLKATGTTESTNSASAKGSDERGTDYVKMLSTNKMGYMACLKNLKNIWETGNTEAIQLATTLIEDPVKVSKAKILPFRFNSAMEVLKGANGPGAGQLRSAVETALDNSINNLPDFPGSTLILMDTSGSMSSTWHSVHRGSPDAKPPYIIASIFAAALYKRLPNADLMLFDTRARFYNPSKSGSILSIADHIKSECRGGGTYYGSAFDLLVEKNTSYDRIIVLTDEQSWYGQDEAALKKYRQALGARSTLFHFDVVSYGTVQLKENDVFMMGGVSEKTIKILGMLETDKNALITEIEKVEL